MFMKVELLQLDARSIRVSKYLMKLPPQPLLSRVPHGERNEPGHDGVG